MGMSGQVRVSHGNPGQVRACQGTSGQVKASQSISGQVSTYATRQTDLPRSLAKVKVALSRFSWSQTKFLQISSSLQPKILAL